MPRTQPPFDEEKRLRTVRSFGQLDSSPDWKYDSLTALCADLLDMPFANLSIVDEKRQFFKSRIGINFSETPRSISFCNETIKGHRPYVVRDATKHEVHKDSPLVTNNPGYRFYAGMPIRIDGQSIGALCVMDRRTREPTPEQLDRLSLLANVAAAMLIADRRFMELAAANAALLEQLQKSA